LSQFTRLTDEQTDGRTDRILIARPRLHFMLGGKKLRNYGTVSTVKGSDRHKVSH